MTRKGPPWTRDALLLVATLVFLLIATCASEFVYNDFEKVTALVFNGDAKTTSCDAGERLAYQGQHGVNDPSTEFEAEVIREDTRFIETETRRVNDHSTAGTVDVDLAGFSHRDGGFSFGFCSAVATANRPRQMSIRLTPSRSHARMKRLDRLRSWYVLWRVRVIVYAYKATS